MRFEFGSILAGSGKIAIPIGEREQEETERERNESERPNSTHLSSAIKNYTCFTNNGFSIMPNTKLQRFLRVKFGGGHHLRGRVDRQVSSKSHLPT